MKKKKRKKKMMMKKKMRRRERVIMKTMRNEKKKYSLILFSVFFSLFVVIKYTLLQFELFTINIQSTFYWG